MPKSASGTINDRHKKSYVESPSRGEDFSAQEVYLGNFQQLADAITVSIGSGGSGGLRCDQITVDILAGENSIDFPNLSTIKTVMYKDSLDNEIDFANIITDNQLTVCSNINEIAVTIIVTGES